MFTLDYHIWFCPACSWSLDINEDPSGIDDEYCPCCVERIAQVEFQARDHAEDFFTGLRKDRRAQCSK